MSFWFFFTFHKCVKAQRHIQKNAISKNIGKNLIIRLIKFAHRVNIGVHIHSANAVLLNTKLAQFADSITFIILS